MTRPITVLLIDDEEKVRLLLKRIISLEGYVVRDACNLTDGMALMEKEQADIVLCDVKLPDGNGVSFVSKLKAKYPCCEIILLTAYGNIPDCVLAIKNGAFDYIVKGNDNDKIIPLLNRVSEKLNMQGKLARLENQLLRKYGFDAILGNSPAIADARRLAEKVANVDTPVLLLGETGSGKEVFARAIHYGSPRKQNAFVALNCSTLGRDIIESELFGHKAGSFTGAVKDKKGLIEEARGGTLFLDEIGEMPLELQPKLLRFLENGTYYRVGETTEQKADVRLITATNRDLKQEGDHGRFRTDLYYRIAVFTITIPPLRDRSGDILLLAKHYLNEYCEKQNKKIAVISGEAERALLRHQWMGNVRELKNVLERAVILEDTDELQITSLPWELQQLLVTGSESSDVAGLQLATIERLHIRKVLGFTKGNKADAARLLGIGLATLYRKIEEYQLK